MATEKRLIDANALIDEWNTLIKKMRKDSDGAYPVDFAIVISAVSKANTVDAVEVVRCKDCKHYVLHALACRHENFNGIIPMNGYCYYGERKDNATD